MRLCSSSESVFPFDAAKGKQGTPNLRQEEK